MNNDRLPRGRASRPARLIIVDDYELVRAGLRKLLTGQPGLEVVGEAANGREALALCQRLHPDLALIDVRMPEMDGLATCRAIKQECPATSVILITVHENLDYLLEALRVGTAGYLFKDVTQSELISAVRQVLRGESILDKELMMRLFKRLASQSSNQADSSLIGLSPREREVLELLVQGQTNREIAEHLFLSVSTVKIHVEHIFAKLNVSDRTQAAVRAIELGLLPTSSK